MKKDSRKDCRKKFKSNADMWEYVFSEMEKNIVEMNKVARALGIDELPSVYELANYAPRPTKHP